MNGIWQFIQWLIAPISTFLDFIKSALHGLIVILKSFPSVFNLITSSVNYLPSLFATFLFICVSISIIYIVVKFNAGG